LEAVGTIQAKSGSDVCWFCGSANPPTVDWAIVEMYSDRKHVANRTTWVPREVVIPRCARCHQMHKNLRRTMLISSAAAFILTAWVTRSTGVGAILFGTIVAGIATPLVRLCFRIAISRDVKFPGEGLKHPTVLAQKKAGWGIGSPSHDLFAMIRRFSGVVR
jgi:hypothetical protein